MITYGRASQFVEDGETVHVHIGHAHLSQERHAINALAIPVQFLLNYQNYSASEFRQFISKYYDIFLGSPSGEPIATMLLMIAHSSDVYISMDDISIRMGILEILHEKLIDMYSEYDNLLRRNKRFLLSMTGIRKLA